MYLSIATCLAENRKPTHRVLIKIVLLFFLVNPHYISGRHITDDDAFENHLTMETELQLLTIANESKLHSQDYHVVKIALQNESSFMMQLTKPDIFELPDKDTNHEMNQLHCVYSGSVTSSAGKIVGMASLSSCRYESAFEGLISINNQHFQVAPVFHKPHKSMNGTSGNQRIKRSTRTRSFKYKMAPAMKSTGKVPRRAPMKLPIRELTKARQQMVKDQEGLEDEEDDDSEDSTDDNTEQTQTHTLIDDNDISGEDINTLQNLEMAYAIRKQNANGRAKAGARQPARVIELALFSDASFFQVWKAKFPEKAEAKIKEYLLTLVNNMNYVYKQPSLQVKISFRLVHVGIQKETPAGLKPSTNSSNYLDSFCNFQGKKDEGGRFWDHGMMITAQNLTDDTGNGLIGVAFSSTMCLRYYSCSLIEYTKGFETAFTATHEVGHSLGMDHDGETFNKKCNPGKFIMAAVADSGQINWSKCSVANLKNFLRSGDPAPRAKDPSAVPRCLVKRGKKKAQINYRRTATFPGRKFTAKTQCQVICSGCAPVTGNTAPFNNICWMLHCQDEQTGEIIEAHPALEGTSCGNGKKMCRNGRCQ